MSSLESHHLLELRQVVNLSEEYETTIPEAAQMRVRNLSRMRSYSLLLEPEHAAVYTATLAELAQLLKDHPNDIDTVIDIFTIRSRSEIPSMLARDSLCGACPNNHVSSCPNCNLPE